MTNEALFRLFSKFGNVISARIMVEKATGRSRGFGEDPRSISPFLFSISIPSIQYTKCCTRYNLLTAVALLQCNVSAVYEKCGALPDAYRYQYRYCPIPLDYNNNSLWYHDKHCAARFPASKVVRRVGLLELVCRHLQGVNGELDENLPPRVSVVLRLFGFGSCDFRILPFVCDMMFHYQQHEHIP